MQLPPLCSGVFYSLPKAFIAVAMQVPLLRSGVNSLPTYTSPIGCHQSISVSTLLVQSTIKVIFVWLKSESSDESESAKTSGLVVAM